MSDLECMIKALRMTWIPRPYKGRSPKLAGKLYLIASSRVREA